jgi:hypothetical protein
MAAQPAEKPLVRVEVVRFDIPFGQMIWLMVKWAIAAIPALVILAIIGAVIATVLGGTLMGLSGIGRV